MTPRAQQRQPDGLPFTSASLIAISQSFAHRAKAIKYHSSEFVLIRETEDRAERLNCDVALIGRPAARVRLSIWDDGSMYLGVHLPGTRREGGWAFEYRRNGSVNGIEPSAIVAMLEESLLAAHFAKDSSWAATRLDDIWARARMQPE